MRGVQIGHLQPWVQFHRCSALRVRSRNPQTGTSPQKIARGSKTEAEKILEAHFKEELGGRMKSVSEKEASKRYPDKSLRVAAQGILDKPDGGHRIITGWHPRRQIEQRDPGVGQA